MFRQVQVFHLSAERLMTLGAAFQATAGHRYMLPLVIWMHHILGVEALS